MRSIRILAAAITLIGGATLTSHPAVAAAATTALCTNAARPSACTDENWEEAIGEANANCSACFTMLECHAYVVCGESYYSGSSYSCHAC